MRIPVEERNRREANSHRSVKSRDLGVSGEQELGIASLCKNYLLTRAI